MSTRGSNQMNHRLSISKEAIYHKKSSINRAARNRAFAENCGFRLPKGSELSPIRFLKRVGSNVVKGLRLVSLRWRRSPKVSSSGRSKPFVAPFDSGRTEAIEDCIEFINSSSSLPRSNSVSANPC